MSSIIDFLHQLRRCKTVMPLILLTFLGMLCNLATACGNVVQTAGFTDVQYAFPGLARIKARLDGSWLLEWETIPDVPVTYEIFSRDGAAGSEFGINGKLSAAAGSYDFGRPVAKTTESFYISENLLLKNNTCFVVRMNHPDYKDENTKELCTGHRSKAANISSSGPPVFNSLTLINGASDGKLNAAEILEDLPVVALDALNYTYSRFAVLDPVEKCSESSDFVMGIPKTSAFLGLDSVRRKVCVKLFNAAGDVAHGESEPFLFSTVAPLLSSVQLSDTVINSTERISPLSVTVSGTPFVSYRLSCMLNCSVTSGETGSLSSGEPGSAVAQVSVTGEGLFRVSVQLIDSAGNRSPEVVSTGQSDFTPPSVSLGSPSVTAIQLNGTFTIPVSIGGASSIDLQPAHVNISGASGCNVTISNGTTSNPTVNLETCSQIGTVTISVAPGFATDAAGNLSLAAGPSTTVNINNTVPVLNSLSLVNGASDGILNASEAVANQPVVSLDASGFDLVNYAVVDSTATCNASQTYALGLPLASGVAAIDGSSKKICVKLSNNLGASTYGGSGSIVVDKTPPATPSPALNNGASGGTINASTASANAAVVSFTPSGGDTASYAVADNAGACGAGLTFAASIPTAGSSAFANGSNKVVCVKVSDVAGNVAYGSSPSITVDTQAPLAPILTSTALADGFINIAENTAAGFAVVLNGEANASYTLSCTTNCTVVSGGTVAAGGISSSGSLSASGAATVYLNANAGGSFSFSASVSDGSNASSNSTSSAIADLTQPVITFQSPTPTTVNSGQTVSYILNLTDTGGTGVSTVSIQSSDVAFTGNNTGCIATVSGGDLSTRTIGITGCAAAGGSVGISLPAGKVTDTAGNTSAAATSGATFNVSNPAPSLTVTAPANNAQKASTNFNLQGTCVPGLLVIVTSADITGQVASQSCTGTGTFAIPIQLSGSDGSKNILVTEQDSVGQLSTQTRSFIKDTIAPSVSVGSPSGSLVNNAGSVNYNVSFSDTNGVSAVTLSSVTLHTTGGATCANSVTVSGVTSATVTLSGCTGNGTVGISVPAGAATDAAGNPSLATGVSSTFTVDTTPPSLNILTPTASTNFVTQTVTTALTGTCESGLTVTLIGDVESSQSTTCIGGVFSLGSWLLTNTQGAKLVQVRQQDAAGNVGTSASVNYTLNSIEAFAQRSIRFLPENATSLTRTFSSTGDRTGWTWSGWFKRTRSTSGRQVLFGGYGGSNDTDWLEFGFEPNDTLYWTTASYTSAVSVVFNSFTTWNHLVISYDGTTLRPYLNGVAFSFPSSPSGPRGINGAWLHKIGEEPGYPSWSDIRSYAGLLSNIHFIDGSVLTPSSFGATESGTGRWRPITYSGSFGANGFWLNFSDNSSNASSALGKDSSSNTNHWTPKNLSVGSGSNVFYSGFFANDAFDGIPGPTNEVNFNSGGTINFTSGINFNTLSITYGNMANGQLGNPSSGAVLSINGTNVTAQAVAPSPFNSNYSKIYSQNSPGVLNSIGISPGISGSHESRLLDVKINGLSLQATHQTLDASNDSLVDSPNSYGTDTGLGGEVRGNYCVLDPKSANGGTVSKGGQLYIGPGDWRRVNGSMAVSSGKWYYEVNIVGEPYSPAGSNSPYHLFGWGLASVVKDTTNPNSSTTALILGDNGYLNNFNASGTSVTTFAHGDVVSVAVDLDNNTYQYRKNNVSVASGTLGVAAGSLLVPVIISYNSSYGTMETNFGQRRFIHQAPSGYKALVDSNLPSTSFARSEAIAASRSIDIKSINPSAASGWYWIRTNGIARSYWVDMDYDGGGWVLVGSHPQNISIPTLTFAQAAQSYDGYGSSTYGSGDPKTYATWVGLNAWTAITSANAAGKNLVYFVANSAQALGNTSAHVLRSRWKWDGWTSTFAFNNANTLVNELGSGNPDWWDYHIGFNFSFSTNDNDQDDYSANCAAYYGNAPWWYGSCWAGSLWGGNGATHTNSAYWTSSGSEYFGYGAAYVK